MRARARLLAGFVAFGALTNAGGAAVAAADTAADNANTEATSVEPVIVTANKREENVQDVPISMNVVSQATLENYDRADLRGLSSVVPGLIVLKSNSINTISLRGFGSSAANPAIEQTVALYVDGVFAGRARQYMAPFFDVARVEVMRGPQGALLGKNTAAGAVSIVTNEPTSTFEGAATASFLIDRNGVDAYGYVSGPIGESLAARLAFKVTHDNGWVLNTATGEKDPQQNNYALRGSLAWNPGDAVKVVGRFQYDDLRTDGRAMTAFPANQPSATALQPIKAASGLLGVTDYDRQHGYHGSVVGTFGLGGGVDLVSISGYERYDSDSWAAASHADPVTFGTRFVERFSQISQELRLVSPTSGRFEWIVGGYADRSWHHVDNIVRYKGLFVIFNLDGQMTSNFKQVSTSFSAYATGTFKVSDQLRLVGGLRWSYVHKDGAYVLARDFGQNFIGSAPLGPLTGALTNEHFDPSVTVQYDITPHVMAYLSWSNGSKGGTFQGANRSVTAATFMLQPEESTNYEAGVKSQFGGWLTLNAAIWRLDFRNLQAGQYVNGVLLTKNAGAARSQGVEMVAQAVVGPFVFDAQGAYTDAKYTDYPGAPCTQAQLDAGCVNGVTPVNAAGRTFAFVPKWSGRAGVTWSHDLNDQVKLSVNVAATFSGSYFADAGTFNPLIGYQPAWAKVDFRAEVADRNDHWSLAVVGRNVNNRLTNGGVYPWPFHSPPLAVYAIDELRSVSIQGTVRF